MQCPARFLYLWPAHFHLPVPPIEIPSKLSSQADFTFESQFCHDKNYPKKEECQGALYESKPDYSVQD